MIEVEREESIKAFIKVVNESDIAAYCVMDYWTFDWCIALRKYVKTHPHELEKAVFNGMELRVECPTDYRLNIHVILSDSLSEQRLSDFKSELKIRIGSKPPKNLSEEALIEFARSLSTDKAKIHGYADPSTLGEAQLIELGSKTAVITKDSLLEAFKHIPSDSGYILLPYDTSDGLLELDWSKHPQDDNFFMQTATIFEARDLRNIDLFKGKRTDENAAFFENFYKTIGNCPKPCISGSDAHSFPEYGVYPSDRITWIKADPTFEGLKQIIFDPESRVYIGERPPVAPTNVIESLTFNIPDDAKITVEQVDGSEKEESFCFADQNASYELSPFFNCFIGGRGSGKSTVLNFLGQHSNTPDSSEKFWRKLRPSFDISDKEFFSFSGVEQFEFIGQSEVERFASNKDAFTNAIYERANLLSEDSLEKRSAILAAMLVELEDFKVQINSLGSLRVEKMEKEKEKRTLDQSIKITSSKEYSEIVSEITRKSNDKQRLETWRIAVINMRDAIDKVQRFQLAPTSPTDVLNPFDADDLPDSRSDIASPYIKAFEQASANLSTALTILDLGNFAELIELEDKLQKEIEEHESALSELLKKAGLSEENIIQVKSAPQKLVKIEDDLGVLQKRYDDTEKKIKEYPSALDLVQKAKEEHEKAIAEAIKPLVSTLEEQATENKGKDIKNIGLRYFFDEASAWENIAYELYNEFPFWQGGERAEDVKKYILEHTEVFSGGFNDINDHLAKEPITSKYVKFLKDIFMLDENYQIFCVIRDKHLNDVSQYKQIQVLYDGKDIERASFGQKCTAVMVVLLLFGNYPLIIDEPEAHLDSSLIANYLVPLIKKKKTNRQIIFATHNANFVINGDAEKIFILKNETGKTLFAETTIEDLSQREDLLRLEGGREAFKKRGEKLNI